MAGDMNYGSSIPLEQVLNIMRQGPEEQVFRHRLKEPNAHTVFFAFKRQCPIPYNLSLCPVDFRGFTVNWNREVQTKSPADAQRVVRRDKGALFGEI